MSWCPDILLYRGDSLSEWLRWSHRCVPRPCPPYLETVGVDNLVAYGALHQHEVELILFFLQCILLSSLFTHHTHSCVGQNRLHGQINRVFILPLFPIYDNYVVYYTAISAVSLFVQNAYQIIVKVTYSDALSHNTRLLHASWSSKLLHVFAEMTLSTLGPEASLTLPAACPPASRSRWATIGRQLNRCCCRRCPHLGLWPVGRPLLEDK